MSPPVATCQCPLLPDLPCASPITQEDLLCNECRVIGKDDGSACSAVKQPDGTVWGHLPLLGFKRWFSQA